MSEATLIVPPTYEATMVGVTAIRLSARKLYQLDSMLRTIKSCRRSANDDLSGMDFLDLVALIDTHHFLEEAAKGERG